MKNHNNSGVALAMFYVVLCITLVIGYIMNIVEVFGSENLLSTGVGILRIVGIFIAPLGGILGYF